MAGDVIGADFSTAGGAATNYNTFNFTLNTPTTAALTVSSGSVVRLKTNGANAAGSTIAGVSLSLTPSSGSMAFNDDSNANNWGGTAADPYYTTAADDIVYGTPNAAVISYKISGLDDALTYNVRVYALINGGATTDSLSFNSGPSMSLGARATRFNAATLSAAGLVFNNQVTDGSGNLTVNLLPGNANSFANAVVVEVVPEPTSAASLSLGIACTLLSRRRRRS